MLLSRGRPHAVVEEARFLERGVLILKVVLVVPRLRKFFF